MNALTTLLSAHDPGTGTHGSQLNYRAFMRVLAAIGAESLADAFTPVAGQGLQARPTPLEQLVLPVRAACPIVPCLHTCTLQPGDT